MAIQPAGNTQAIIPVTRVSSEEGAQANDVGELVAGNATVDSGAVGDGCGCSGASGAAACAGGGLQDFTQTFLG